MVKLTEQELTATEKKVSSNTPSPRRRARQVVARGAPASVRRQTDLKQTGTRAFIVSPWGGMGEAGTPRLGLPSLHIPAGSKALRSCPLLPGTCPLGDQGREIMAQKARVK